MEQEKKNLELICELDDVLTYALVHNGGRIIRDICVKNHSESDIEGLVLRINSSSEWIEPLELGIEKIKPGEELHFKKLDVKIQGAYLASLTERIQCSLRISVSHGEEELVSETKETTALAFDQWPGLQYTPELLAAFLCPTIRLSPAFFSLPPSIWKNGPVIHPLPGISSEIPTA